MAKERWASITAGRFYRSIRDRPQAGFIPNQRTVETEMNPFKNPLGPATSSTVLARQVCLPTLVSNPCLPVGRS